MSTGHIRELQETDDFSRISELMGLSVSRMRKKTVIRCAPNADYLKSVYFGEDSEAAPAKKGFVSTKNGHIVAFAGVYLSEQSRNGLLAVGFDPAEEQELPPLLDLCIESVRRQGGSRIGRFISLEPGYIRNEEITFWERYGFLADPFYHTLIKMEVDEWSVPEKLDTTGIAPAAESEIGDIARMLLEDNEEYLADEYSENYEKPSPDQVYLTLKHPDTDEILGVAYYRVSRFKDKRKDGKTYDGLGAWDVGFHFRTEYRLPRLQKRRFIQAVLASMKQLDVIFASARVSSRDFDCLIELFAEGFDFQGSPEIQNRMCRNV